MEMITNFLKAVFNFFVGDWIILIGVAITIVVVALVENVGALEGLKGLGGVILLLGVALTLALTLRRETVH